MSGGSMNYIYLHIKEATELTEDETIAQLLTDLSKVLHDEEWADCSDISDEEYQATLLKFKRKWLEREPKAEWIPVHKRLPEPFRFVNCTCHSLIDNREDWVIETCYVPQPPGSPYSDWGNIPMLNHGDCKVVAWMYRDIPKPYKESEE